MFRFSYREHLWLMVFAALFFIISILCIYETKKLNTAKSSMEYYAALNRDLSVLEQKYNTAKAQNRQNGRMLKVSLFSLIDKITRKNRFDSKVVFIKPYTRNLANGISLDMVEIRLNNISMKQIVHFLYDVEIRYKNRVFVKRLKIRKNQNLFLGVDAVFFTYKKGTAK